MATDKQLDRELKIIIATIIVACGIGLVVIGDLNNRLKQLESFHTETVAAESFSFTYPSK